MTTFISIDLKCYFWVHNRFDPWWSVQCVVTYQSADVSCFHPIKCKTHSNADLLTRHFPRLPDATGVSFKSRYFAVYSHSFVV